MVPGYRLWDCPVQIYLQEKWPFMAKMRMYACRIWKKVWRLLFISQRSGKKMLSRLFFSEYGSYDLFCMITRIFYEPYMRIHPSANNTSQVDILLVRFHGFFIVTGISFFVI